MEVAIIKARVVESQEAIMTRSLHGLIREIQDIVELHYYTSLTNSVHQATKVELQLKRDGVSKRSYPSSSLKGKERKEERPKKDKSPKKGSVPPSGRKEEIVTSSPSTSKTIFRQMTHFFSISLQNEHGFKGQWRSRE
ncbi:hypothetical protein CR513_41243, partial [Mucuna pruriens]